MVPSHMPSETHRVNRTNPGYVATVASVLATGAVVFFAALTRSGPTVNDVIFVALSITVPATLAYELARRL
ncbi:hypothetical protein [Haloplanus sp.]|uniref:hypothetical protein n=1 Tax=Haloplanus sp. TaxID=1961696 RepID=UPI0026315927|nr:hypothetical protein [Haloplanus sp.]